MKVKKSFPGYHGGLPQPSSLADIAENTMDFPIFIYVYLAFQPIRKLESEDQWSDKSTASNFSQLKPIQRSRNIRVAYYAIANS
jgi:hypothetical protein